MDWKLQEKILSPFHRLTTKGHPDRNKLMLGQWTTPEFEALQDAEWNWSLKLDGVNTRVNWDGIRVTFGGRTDDAQLNVNYLQYLRDTFTEEIFESVFGKSTFTLFGEGLGPKVQQKGEYFTEPTFVLFDVFSYGSDYQLYLKPEAVEDVAHSLGIDVAPHVDVLSPNEVIQSLDDLIVPGKFPQFPKIAVHEGVVGKPVGGFLARNGSRIAMKVKTRDQYTSEVM